MTRSLCGAVKDFQWRYSPHLMSMHHRALTEQVTEHLQRLAGLHRASRGCSSALCALSGLLQPPSFGLVCIMCYNCAESAARMQHVCPLYSGDVQRLIGLGRPLCFSCWQAAWKSARSLLVLAGVTFMARQARVLC